MMDILSLYDGNCMWGGQPYRKRDWKGDFILEYYSEFLNNVFK